VKNRFIGAEDDVYHVEALALDFYYEQVMLVGAHGVAVH
jgi:hypothetical protein